MRKMWRELFKKPGRGWNSLPFWGWNDILEEKEVAEQIQKGAEAGIGGFFVHSRDGLETPYMEEQWFSCMEKAVLEAKKNGMQIWMYDEDRWPSGTAGGLVTSKSDAFCCKGLTLEVLEASELSAILSREKWRDEDCTCGILALYAARVKEMEMGFFVRLQKSWIEEKKAQDIAAFEHFLKKVSKTGDEWRNVYLLVRLEVSEKSEWFNGEAPPDQLNPETAREFIACTHEKYKKRFGEYFGNVIPGIFTDEPSLHDRHAFFGEKRGWIPWTYGFSEYFLQQKGYEFLDVLPWFYFNAPESNWVRHDYWQVVSRRYGEAYFGTIGDWCRKNHLKFTGHFLQEDRMGLSSRVNGSVMSHYVYQDVPGIDMLTEQTREFLTVKQCTSVASQYEKPEVLTETYGCTGWDFTFESQKWMGDWQFVLGVTRRCQHIALYSLRGCRKRDYPPSFNYNINWWKENHYIEEYFGRLSAILSHGKAVRRILLLHPVSTVWSHLGTSPYGNPVRRKERDVPQLDQFGNNFNALLESILRQHFDCDLGDEELLMRDGSVEGQKLRLKTCTYDMVVVPPMETMYQSTCCLLTEFGKQGGKILFCEARPNKLEGHLDEKGYLDRIFGEVVNEEILMEKLEEIRTVSVKEKDTGYEATDILYQVRKIAGDTILFLVNNSRDNHVSAITEVDGSVLPQGVLQAEYLNPLDGSITKVPIRQKKQINQELDCRTEKVCFEITLPPTASALYWITEKRKDEEDEEDREKEEEKRICSNLLRCTRLGTSFSYQLTHENVLPLDQCRYRFNDSEWSACMEVWQAQKEIRKELQMRQIDRNGITQRYKWADIPHPKDGTPITLLFSFEAEETDQMLDLLIEKPEDFSVNFNGKEICMEDCGWFLDKSFRRIRLGISRKGSNEILISCAYKNRMELENIYVLGNFGVSNVRHLTQLPRKMKLGDWCCQGLKHYCGSVIYQIECQCHMKDGRRVYLRVPAVKGTAMILKIQQAEIPVLWNFTEPIDVTSYLREGNNRLELEVIGSPRNMMGPFHGAKTRPENVHDESFCPNSEDYTREYRLVEYGILAEPELLEEERSS